MQFQESQANQKKDWLCAVWGCNKNGDRFLNYKSYFTILDTSSGSEFNHNDMKINLSWILDIKKGEAYKSIYAPISWKKYIDKNKIKPLFSLQGKFNKTKEEQLPSGQEQINMLKELQHFFINKDGGYSFEQFSVDFAKYMDSSITDISITQPFKDGGIDGIGRYKIFERAENSIYVDFYLQAKCYSLDNAVTVKDTARLISRIKNKQFGIMFTTSYIAQQAYKEIIDDGHPVIIITGKNIIDFIYNELETRGVYPLKIYLLQNYSDYFEELKVASCTDSSTKKIDTKIKNVTYKIKHS